MKIINYKSGLGNQIFYYLFTLYIGKMFPHEHVFGYYNRRKLQKHNGLEIQKVFELQLPQATLISNVCAWFCRKLTGIGFAHLKATDDCLNFDAIYFDGWWQDKRYFLDNVPKLKFREPKLDLLNEAILEKIVNNFSISIHVRRGDYLYPCFAEQYGNIATLDYYRKAIEIALLKSKGKHHFFFVFSDDIEWVKEKFPIHEAVYVCNNTGKNSFIDMYLMSYCDINILANSSFSYWGAMLNRRPNHFVIYPAKWNNYKTPDIFPNDWMAL